MRISLSATGILYCLLGLSICSITAGQVLTCRYTATGQEYNGVIAKTKGNIPCQRWDTQTPHKNSYQNVDTFPDRTLQDASNYCRNPSPTQATGPWCYTTASSPRWDYCLIPYCECKTDKIGKGYAGTISRTKSGKTCQRWDQQTPHRHTRNDPKNFPESRIQDAQNYCRNPDKEPSGPWCYTTDRSKRWEFCDVPPCECRATEKGKEYGGRQSTTKSGLTCQRWDSQTPHRHNQNPRNLPERNFTLAINYCRNPDGEPGGPWCYTTNPQKRWEYCDISRCYCKHDALGKHYMGSVDKTHTGKTCQRWDSQEPHDHTYTDSDKFPDLTLKDAENHCRNPSSSSVGPWCYTNDPDIRWEYCIIPDCDCKDTEKGFEYIGNISKTVSGLTCQAWSSQFPHTHHDNDPSLFPDRSLEQASNKCRNPNNKRARPWCYTTDANIIWEFCNVPRCDCRLTQQGQEYVGSVNITTNKTPCQRWDQQYPHTHTMTNPALFPDKTLAAANNYCRNPGGTKASPWCYTMDQNTEWAYCEIDFCRTAVKPTMPTNPSSTTPVFTGQKECKSTKQGTEYTGVRSHTISGRTCQRWDSQSPHHHTSNTADQFPDNTVLDASNYCRNPDYSPLGPWCFTTDSSTRWEYCDIPTCDCKLTVQGTEYAGTVTATESGKVCQRWDSFTPHGHDPFHPEDFPGKSVQRANNYCRNPTSHIEPYGPWCYTTDPNTAWEYCDLKLCECRKTPLGRDYIGRISRTMNGKICQRWDSQNPHAHNRNYPTDFPDKTVGEASNYCRNPTSDPQGPWCYTTDINVEKESCDIPKCPGVYFPSGTQNIPTSTRIPVPQPEARTDNISKGEIAGIVIGCIIVLCFIVLSFGFVLWKYRHQTGIPYLRSR